MHRSPPAVLADRVPAHRQPQFGPSIASIFNEGDVVSIGDKRPLQCEWLQVDLMSRRLVIERETFAGVPDFAQPAGILYPVRPWDSIAGRQRIVKQRWEEWIAGEDMLDVGQD